MRENRRFHDQRRHHSRGFNSFRLGQIFSIIYNLAILYLVYKLTQSQEKGLALEIFFGNIALITFGLLITSFNRKNNFNKPRRDRRFRNRDERREERRDDRREERR